MNELSKKSVENTLPANDEDYSLIEDALLKNPRGRWFLEEHVKRNRPEDTQKLLEAIQRIENNLENKPSSSEDDLDPIRMSIIEMSKAIARTRQEIQSIKPEDDADNHLIGATEELSAIVESTENATNTILEAAEEIQEAAWLLREAGAQGTPIDKIDEKTTDIYMACSFQDITGQRTTKVVQALCYIENRVNAMIDIWGLNDMDSTPSTPREDNSDSRPDAHLLNGPAKMGEALDQNNIDDMMFGVDEDGESLADSLSFDAIDPASSDIDDLDFATIEIDAEPAPQTDQAPENQAEIEPAIVPDAAQVTSPEIIPDVVDEVVEEEVAVEHYESAEFTSFDSNTGMEQVQADPNADFQTVDFELTEAETADTQSILPEPAIEAAAIDAAPVLEPDLATTNETATNQETFQTEIDPTLGAEQALGETSIEIDPLAGAAATEQSEEFSIDETPLEMATDASEEIATTGDIQELPPQELTAQEMPAQEITVQEVPAELATAGEAVLEAAPIEEQALEQPVTTEPPIETPASETPTNLEPQIEEAISLAQASPELAQPEPIELTEKANITTASELATEDDLNPELLTEVQEETLLG